MSLPLPERKPLRLPGYDYSLPGTYYVTIVTFNRLCLFGYISDTQMCLNPIGKMLENQWLHLPKRFANLEIDEFVIMPNHFHGVITLLNDASPTPTLATIIRAFKSSTTYRWHLIRSGGEGPLWQRNYYEHIIRSEQDLDRARQYIRSNPTAWEQDKERP